MKKILFLLPLVILSLNTFSQKFRFNKKLNDFCVKSTQRFDSISSERKFVLNKIAQDLVQKKGVVFTCYTNTRRTQLLQTWMQTAFFYYSIYDRTAFSYGDTISEVAPPVIAILRASGFVFSETETSPKMWLVYIGEENEGYVIYPKLIDTYKDENDNVVVSICADGEPSSSVGTDALSLPYQSPRRYEGTPDEKNKYESLNRQISIEMLYLAEKTLEAINAAK